MNKNLKLLIATLILMPIAFLIIQSQLLSSSLNKIIAILSIFLAVIALCNLVYKNLRK